MDKVGARKGVELEREFFAKHPVYSTMPRKYVGTKSLIEK